VNTVDRQNEPPLPFEPARHLTKVGGNDYLETKWRLVWLRDQYPDASIVTEHIIVYPPGNDPEGNLTGFALFRATATLPSGGSATGYGSESIQDFRDFIEKAETKAIGRALAALGFGTQFSMDFAGEAAADRPVDSPVKTTPRPPAKQATATVAPPAAPKQVTAAPRPQPAAPKAQPPATEAKPIGNPNNPASVRQINFAKELIDKQGEKGEDFMDRLTTLTSGEISEWIKQLQLGVLPWLTLQISPPAETRSAEQIAADEAAKRDEMLRSVLQLDATKTDQQKHWDHWVALAGNDMGKWHNLGVQAQYAVKIGGDGQKWRYNIMARYAPDETVLSGIQHMAERQGVFNPDLESTLFDRQAELDEAKESADVAS
jgi:hypothetical protein